MLRFLKFFSMFNSFMLVCQGLVWIQIALWML